MRSDQEIRAEIEDIEARTGGSYEEQAGAIAALEWVLGYTAVYNQPIRQQLARAEHVAPTSHATGKVLPNRGDGFHWLRCVDCGREWAEKDSGAFAKGSRSCTQN